jgi:hypothetical protein
LIESVEVALPTYALYEVANTLDSMKAKTKQEEAHLVILLDKPLS